MELSNWKADREGLALAIFSGNYHSVKTCGTIFTLNGPSFLTAEMREEQLKAEELLAKMELFESLANLRGMGHCENVRREISSDYRDLIGVVPENREELRRALHVILDDGGGRVQDVVDLINAGF